MKMLSEIWFQVQVKLFPHLEAVMEEPLTERLKQLVGILEVLRIEEHVRPGWRQWMGRMRLDRRPMARAFVAKAVYNLPTTELLLDMLHNQPSLRRICGWERRSEIPSLSTFSRAFAEFAAESLGDRVHQALVADHITGEDITENIVHHISRDSTEVEAREKPVPKDKKESAEAQAKVKRNRGRPKKDEKREPPPPTRLQKQMKQTPEEAIAELPIVCDVGAKLDTKGHMHWWQGWKLHIDWTDGGLPVNALTTSASLHDSQVAIPMSTITSRRVTYLYELADSAYDANLIHEHSRSLGHVPIIDQHGRRKDIIPFDPATERRYRERTVAERGNSRLKDEFGLRHLRVRGHPKAHLHNMLGLIALFADQALKLFGFQPA